MSRKLFVGNLPYSVTSERLQEAFSQFGTVTSSKVIVDRETGRSRGFAFVTVNDDAKATAAITALNGKDVDGRALTVRKAEPKPPREGGGGGGVAIVGPGRQVGPGGGGELQVIDGRRWVRRDRRARRIDRRRWRDGDRGVGGRRGALAAATGQAERQRADRQRGSDPDLSAVS